MLTLTGRLLSALVRACCRRPVLTVIVALGLTAIAIPVTLWRLTFETSSLHLLPPGLSYVTRYRDYSRDFGELDEIIIAIRGQTLDQAKAYASRLVRRLATGPIRFQHLAFRISPDHFDGRALLYVPTDDLKQIRDRILDHQDVIDAFAAAPGLVTLVEAVNQQIAGAFVTHLFDLGLHEGAEASDLRFVSTLVGQMRERLDHAASYRSPWSAMLSVNGADDDGYFLSEDKSLLFILADPVGEGRGGFTNDQAAIQQIRRDIVRLRAEFPGVEAGVTGGPALSNDEMRTAFADSTLATGIASVATLGLLLLAFRRLGQPLLLLLVLAASLTWSLGIITLTVGHLTVFSVMFISIVIGIGIDYGIYVLFRCDEEMTLGRTLPEALSSTAARAGPGILLGALTAAATFYVLMLTDFHGVQELGFVAGTALLVAFGAMLTLFPALLILTNGRRPAPIRSAVPPARPDVPVIAALTRHPAAVLLGAAIITALSCWAAPTVGLDYNLLNLQARGVESVIWEQQILATGGRSSFAALSSAMSLEELRRKHDAFAHLSSVSDVDSALLVIPDDQAAKLKIIRDFRPVVAAISVGPSPELDLDRLVDALRTLRRRMEIAASEAEPGSAVEDVRDVRRRVAELLETLEGTDHAVSARALGIYQEELSRDFIRELSFLQKNLEPRPVGPDDVPAELRRKFISNEGRFLLQIHPAANIWRREAAARFVEQLRSVDPDVTGTPVIAYESMRRMETAYRHGALYALMLVSAITAWMIRRFRETLLALTPLVLGTLWAIGLMHIFGLTFNFANVWGVPLIIGASAEYGVNVVTRSMEAHRYGGPAFARSTVRAVALNGLTTISGFGSLLVASHQGIWSLGLLLTIGSVTSLVASLVVLPVLIRLFGPRAREADLGRANA